MSSINQGGNLPSTPATSGEQSAMPQITADEAMTSLPHMNLDAHVVQKDVNALLQRAGLERTAEGGLQVKDSAAVGRTSEVKDLSAAEQIYAAGETQLKPPAPPKVEMTKELRAGAETFANNLDIALDEALPKIPELSKKVVEGAITDKVKDEIKDSKLGTSRLGMQADVKAQEKLGDAEASKLGKVVEKEGVAGSKDGTKTATNAVAPGTTQISQSDVRRLAELSANALLAAFLKLNISDPNNSVETHNKLHTVMSELRQKGIKDAKAEIKNAQEAKKEAEAYAEQAQYISTVISVVMIAVTLLLTFLTMGAGALLFVAVAMAIGAVIGAMAGGTEGALQGASIAGSIGSFGASAAVNAAAQTAQLTAKQIVQQLIKSIKNMISKMISKLTQMFAKQAAQTTAQMAAEASKTIAQEVVKKLGEQTVKVAEQIAQKSGQKLAELSKDQLAKVMEQATKKVMEQSTKLIADQSTKVATETIQSMSKQQLQTFVQEAQNMTMEQVQKMSTEQLQKMATEHLKNELQKTLTKAMQETMTKAVLQAVPKGMMSETTANIIRAAVTAGGEITKAGANMTATEKMLDAQQSSIEAKRFRMLAEMMQQQIEEENEIMKMIMESKNQTVDAVIKMMNAMFASTQKLMSAGMAK